MAYDSKRNCYSRFVHRWLKSFLVLSMPGLIAAQSPLDYTINTPRPINPAEGTTSPSAQATQRQNPFLGSVPSRNTGSTLELSLKEAIDRGLRYNLGLIESTQASATVRAERLRVLSALLPQLSINGRQAYEDISYKEIGLKLPAIPGFPELPPTSGGFGYQDARVVLTQSIYQAQLRNELKAKRFEEQASTLSLRDSRDVVVFAVGLAYMQVIASMARVETAKAQLLSAEELERQTADRFASELTPEIDALRSEVGYESAGQRLINVTNQLEKDKLTLTRITGLAIDQDFVLTDRAGYHPVNDLTLEGATQMALRARADVQSAEASIRAASLTVHAQKAQSLPDISVAASYGGGGPNAGNFEPVYSVVGSVAVPLYTGGRIHAEVEQAKADLARRQAEYEDLKGRVAYDVRVAWLDLSASNSAVKIADRNKSLAERALGQSRDRYENGVTNYLEVVQAEEALAAASENQIQSLFSLNVATVSLARAVGDTENMLPRLLGEK
jgi:outer membrane protein TolC